MAEESSSSNSNPNSSYDSTYIPESEGSSSLARNQEHENIIHQLLAPLPKRKRRYVQNSVRKNYNSRRNDSDNSNVRSISVDWDGIAKSSSSVKWHEFEKSDNSNASLTPDIIAIHSSHSMSVDFNPDRENPNNISPSSSHSLYLPSEEPSIEILKKNIRADSLS